MLSDLFQVFRWLGSSMPMFFTFLHTNIPTIFPKISWGIGVTDVAGGL